MPLTKRLSVKFPSETDYKKTLEKFKTAFDKKWLENKPSSAENLDQMERLSILGNGAFGTVVCL